MSLRSCSVCSKELPDSRIGATCSLCSIGFTPVQNPVPALRSELPPMGPAAQPVSFGLAAQIVRDRHCRECGAVLANMDFAAGSCPICRTHIEEIPEYAREVVGNFALGQLPRFDRDMELGKREWPADAPIW